MTAALLALCAVLAVALVREGYANIRANRKIEALRIQSDKFQNSHFQDSMMLSSAIRLLKDKRARAKEAKHSEWLTEVDELERKWRGEL